MRASSMVLWLVLLSGCSGVDTSGGRGGSRVLRQRAAYSPHLPEDEHGRTARIPLGTAIVSLRPGEKTRQAVEMGLLEVDAFERLLVHAGLDDLDELPPRVNPFTPEDAVEVLGRLMNKPVTLGNFPPRMAAGHLLREVLEGGEASREEMVRRVARFSHQQVAVLRPDGYLAWALDGRTQQKVVPVQWKDGAFRAYGFELGRFYGGRGGVFRLLDARLREEDGHAMAEVHDDADVISRSLDGAEDAFLELGLAVGQLLTTPASDHLAALGRLPEGVRVLVASSPEYLERFKYMTRGEQVRALSKLVTSLVTTWGAASTVTRTVGGTLRGLEATAPVLSLSAEGVLVMERVSVPVGQAITVLSGGPGAAIILQRANTSRAGAAPSQGPGQWGPARESMSPRARRYQEQISGRSADDAYWVGGMKTQDGGVKFDGFKDGVLLEAKGPGYANKFLDDLKPKIWFEQSGARALAEQAQRQLRAVSGTGVAIRWHVAEQKTTEAIRALLKRRGITEIEVVFTPPMP